MNALINIPGLLRRSMINPVVLIATAFLTLSVTGLKGYLVFDSLPCLLGVLTLLFILHLGNRGPRSARFGYAACVLLLVGILLPVHTVLYLAISFALLFLVEYFYGKTGFLPLLVLALMSPAVQYLIDVFSFPIRLKLTSLAGSFFNAVGINSISRGNLIIQGSREFSVDPGCMGLNMMQASLLLAIMLIVFYEHRCHRKARLGPLFFYFSVIVLLNILANLLRIIVLVNFNIPSGTIAHEAVGIACLLTYVFLPAVFLAKFVARKGATAYEMQANVLQLSPKKLFFPVLLLAGTFLLTIHVSRADTYKTVHLSVIRPVKGFSASLYTPGVVKLQGSGALIYIKYIRAFYDTDHNPMICWKGSGYVFDQVQQEKFNQGNIYTGVLTKDNDRLYSAWWYSDGETMITDQWTWRLDMIRGKQPYALVNVTCLRKEDLDKEIKKIAEQKTLLTFFNNSVYN